MVVWSTFSFFCTFSEIVFQIGNQHEILDFWTHIVLFQERKIFCSRKGLFLLFCTEICVLYTEDWVCDVALIECTLSPGKSKRGWDSGREGTRGQWGTKVVSLRATWYWGGRFLSQLEGAKYVKRGLARGNAAKGNAPCTVVYCDSRSCTYWNNWIDERYQLYV